MIEKFINIFRRLSGDGRAWKLKDTFTLNSIKAFLSVSKSVRIMFNTIPEQAYPWSCAVEAIPFWERHFGIAPLGSVSIEDRRRAVVTEYVAIGSNAAEYLEYILSTNGHDATVVENLEGVDMGGAWDSIQFKIANGLIAMYPTPSGPVVYTDPVEKPSTVRQWKKVYILYDVFDNASAELMRTLILKYSSSHTVAMLVNNDPDSLYFDGGIVNEIIGPLSVWDAELVVFDNTEIVLDGEMVTA